MHHAQQLCENIVFLLREIKSCEFGTKQTIFSTRSIYTQLIILPTRLLACIKSIVFNFQRIPNIIAFMT